MMHQIDEKYADFRKASDVYNNNAKYDKNQKFNYFFCEKPVWKPVK